MTTDRTKPKLPQSFINKKSEILSAISTPADVYTDRSPKGSIDSPIVALIDEINAIEGLVTTSSCSGRVAVFVEGPKTAIACANGQTTNPTNVEKPGDGFAEEKRLLPKAVVGSPAGKGGGHWLYVSHDPVNVPASRSPNYFSELCGLDVHASNPVTSIVKEGNNSTVSPRLVKLIFSPLILHILCATLHHAKPLLAAAINAGFRESGVQSLKALDDTDAGTMIGIRTMGLGFETIIGMIREDSKGQELYVPMVSEEFLSVMFTVVNERFEWNRARRERLTREIETQFASNTEWEDAEVRRIRKREEGLKKRREKIIPEQPKEHHVAQNDDNNGIGDLFEEIID